MKTVLTKSPQRAAKFILSDEVVAFPTETVYGLGANVFSHEAIEKIFRAKNRPADNPLIAHISSLSEIELLASRITSAAEKLIDAFFPGPLTIVLPKQTGVPDIATASLSTIGVRMPLHSTANLFLKACGVPLVAPSANLSGKPSPTTWQAVREDMDGAISCILKGDQTEVGLESTVVDCTSDEPVLLRAGAITLEQLREIVLQTRLRTAADENLTVRSPGLKYRHYSPKAKVILVGQSKEAVASTGSAYIGLDAPAEIESWQQVLVCRSVRDYAHSLFQFFRQCDAMDVQVIYCQRVVETGLGMALMDRIRRAAHS